MRDRNYEDEHGNSDVFGDDVIVITLMRIRMVAIVTITMNARMAMMAR